jgi:hypothetical protein
MPLSHSQVFGSTVPCEKSLPFSVTEARLKVKSPAQVRRQDRTDVRRPPKQPMTGPGDAIIEAIAQWARDDGEQARQQPPDATQPPHDMQNGTRPSEDRSVGCLHHQGFAKFGTLRLGDGGAKEGAIQRSEAKGVPAAVLGQDEADGGVTQTTCAVVEKPFRLPREYPPFCMQRHTI